MKFIKPIPHQNSRSPRITDDYFDAEALRVMKICKIYGIDIYYTLVETIRGNKDKIFRSTHIGEKFTEDVCGHLRAIGYKVDFERYPTEAGAGQRLIIYLKK